MTNSLTPPPALPVPGPTSGSGPAGPDPEVGAKPERRRFTAEYKLRILKAADHCAPGETGALLRREGLYSSHLTKWRRERERAQVQGLTPKVRGRKPDPQAEEIARLQQENTTLRTRLQQAEAIIEAPKKLSQVFGLIPVPPRTERPGASA